MRTNLLRAAILASAIAAGVSTQATAANLIQNGNFATDDFTDWTFVTTSNGSLAPGGSGLPAVVSFNVTGSGDQNAAEFQVGEMEFGGAPAGGGLSQTITSAAGDLLISADFAAASVGNNGNLAAGLFSLYVNGTFEGSYAPSALGPDEIERGSLAVSVPVTAGSQTIEIIITRPFTNDGYTPLQYVTNISASIEGSASVVPEPSTWAMLLLGFAGLGYAGYRRSRRAVAVI
jgi:PEP-CTERM motif